MEASRFIKFFLLIVVLLLVLSMVYTFCVDPLLHYHKPWFGLRPIIFNDGYYFAGGVAKNFDYDNLIIGSSMSQNFRSSWFEKEFEGITAKATIPGMRPKNIYDLLNICLKKPNTKNVIINFDMAFIAKPNEYRYESFPKYLYDKNYFNDINYLLNKEIDIKYTQHTLSNNRHKQWTDFDSIFVWDTDKDARFGKKRVYDRYFKVEKPTQVNKSYYVKNVGDFCEYIENYPSVTFYLFLSPYSIAYWGRQIKYDTYEGLKEFIYYSFSQLLKYDNCKVYLLSDQYSLDYMSNLDNYRDTQHYDSKMNKYIANCLGTDVNLLTKDNYKQRLDDFFAYIESYDYENMFKDLK